MAPGPRRRPCLRTSPGAGTRGPAPGGHVSSATWTCRRRRARRTARARQWCASLHPPRRRSSSPRCGRRASCRCRRSSPPRRPRRVHAAPPGPAWHHAHPHEDPGPSTPDNRSGGRFGGGTTLTIFASRSPSASRRSSSPCVAGTTRGRRRASTAFGEPSAPAPRSGGRARQRSARRRPSGSARRSSSSTTG